MEKIKLAFDRGRYFVKAILVNDNMTRTAFPAFIGSFRSSGPRFIDETKLVNINGQDYLLGKEDEFDFTARNKKSDDKFIPLLGMAIKKCLEDIKDDIDLVLCLCLPPRTDTIEKETLKECLSRPFTLNDHTVNIVQFAILPEGISSYCDIAIDETGKLIDDVRNMDIGVIDFGSSTVDFAFLKDGSADEESIKSHLAGVHDCVKHIVVRIENEMGVLEMREQSKIREAILRQSDAVIIRGEAINLVPYIKEASKTVFRTKIEKELVNFIKQYSPDITYIVGGGASFFKDVLSEAIPFNLTIPDEPFWSSARGMAKYLTLTDAK